MPSLAQLLIALTKKGEARETARDLGRFAKQAIENRRAPEEFAKGIDETAAFHAAEVATWIRPEAIAAGSSGPFDACDLECWLTVAHYAGVAAVPAKRVLTLSESEIAAASGTITFDAPRPRRIIARLARLFGSADAESPAEEAVDMEALEEKLFAAMDTIPEGSMVRHARAGGSNLKALAGSGIIGGEAPEVRFGPNLEIGPGWVRVGNRRRVDTTDRRTIQAIAEGPGGDTHFLARPWIKASRWRIGEDPHRHGTPFAGKGAWPCEWRAFVVRGKVVGVANYYGWIGEATPLDARMALETRALAQRMVDALARQKIVPRYMDTEFARRRPEAAALLEDFGRDDIACTLDFIETDKGLLLLEGGPAHTPFGGGHSCAFSGTSGAPRLGNAMDVNGIAFRLLDGVVLADPQTWEAGRNAPREGRIMTFADAEILAGKD